MTQRHMTMCHLERKEDPYADTDIFPFAERKTKKVN